MVPKRQKKATEIKAQLGITTKTGDYEVMRGVWGSLVAPTTKGRKPVLM